MHSVRQSVHHHVALADPHKAAMMQLAEALRKKRQKHPARAAVEAPVSFRSSDAAFRTG